MLQNFGFSETGGFELPAAFADVASCIRDLLFAKSKSSLASGSPESERAVELFIICLSRTCQK